MGAGSAMAVIPSRWAATRLPGKPLADIHGRPMLAWVVERCLAARLVDRVVVATDDDRIAAAGALAGAEVVRTGSHHRTGSDRIAEAVTALSLDDDALVVNVQGDEPLVDPADIDAVIAALQGPDVDVSTAAAPLQGDPVDPARVKVVTDVAGRALYFSRAPIPAGGPWRVHLGIYGFRVRSLRAFSALPPGRLEGIERLEQLRLLEHGLTLQVVDVAAHHASVDTPADLSRVRALLRAEASSSPPS